MASEDLYFLSIAASHRILQITPGAGPTLQNEAGNHYIHGQKTTRNVGILFLPLLLDYLPYSSDLSQLCFLIPTTGRYSGRSQY